MLVQGRLVSPLPSTMGVPTRFPAFIEDREAHLPGRILAAHVVDAEQISRLTDGAVAPHIVVRLERGNGADATGHLAGYRELVERRDVSSPLVVDDERLT